MPEYINVDGACLYAKNDFKSAIVTQAVLWEKITILKADDPFSRVQCEDGYEGWISNRQFCKKDQAYPLRMVTRFQSPVFRHPDEDSPRIRTVSAGCYAPVLHVQKEWTEMVFPDGQLGWLKSDSFTKIDDTPRNVVTTFSEKFLGIPYLWGGKTVSGMDCSGYVQLLHKLAGIQIRRDSPQQFDDASFVGEKITDGKAGDLLFFSENGNKITHVAVKLEENNIIHARGHIKINSIDKDEKLYDASLINDFVAVKTFLD